MLKDLSRRLIYPSAIIVLLILVLIPFHAILTVWLSSLIGHYTALRLWKEYLLVLLIIFAFIIFITDQRLIALLKNHLIQLILAFLAIELIWGLVARTHGAVNSKALAYGLLSDCRYFIFFTVVLVIASKTKILFKSANRLVLIPAAVVILFGLLEVFVLPHNFLSHFGYGVNTIQPFETINSNSHYVRIISTLRGANPLGAYLLIPLSLLAVLIMRTRTRRYEKLALFTGGLIVLIFSFSRSAWVALILALAIAIYYGLKSVKLRQQLLYLAALVILVTGVIVIFDRHNTHIQNIFFHTQNHSLAPTSSDQNHSGAFGSAVKQLVHEPLGRGPGTAGPASVYNNHPARIAENYFLQIGQELGWLGLIVFLVINVLVGVSLWQRRQNNLSLALLAILVGIEVVNLFSHAWSDDTLAYLWWGLAAIALASVPLKLPKSKLKNWLI